MDKLSAERRFERAAQFQAARLGFGFGDDSWHLLQTLIHAGAELLETEKHLDSESHLSLAEASIRVFTSRMVIEAQQRGVAELKEFTFDAAKKLLCPLWPFC